MVPAHSKSSQRYVAGDSLTRPISGIRRCPVAPLTTVTVPPTVALLVLRRGACRASTTSNRDRTPGKLDLSRGERPARSRPTVAGLSLRRIPPASDAVSVQTRAGVTKACTDLSRAGETLQQCGHRAVC